jgi:hypothetical protein
VDGNHPIFALKQEERIPGLFELNPALLIQERENPL